MSFDMSSERRKLNSWEEQLRQEVGEGDLLLGELGYTPEDLEEIGRLLYGTTFYRAQKRATIDSKLSHVSESWPLSFALYLVLEGIHHYGDEGLFWHGPKQRLKIKDNQTAKCGQCFLQILAKHHLPTFEHSRGLRYVTPILLHGGIPNRYLEEFLDFLYRHEVQNHRIAIDPHILVANWRLLANDLESLSKPVSRFLRHGGFVAEDFVGRCLDLFRLNAESDISSLGLPMRVLTAYQTWQVQRSETVLSKPLRAQIRLRKPLLKVAPYTSGVRLDLPPQQLPSRDAPNEMVWCITVGKQTQQIDTIRQRIENGYRYEATTELLPVPPAAEYAVQLIVDKQCLHEWIYPGIGDIPILLFDPFDDYEADAQSEQEWHKRGDRWILYPSAYALQISGASQQIRQMPQLTGEWQPFSLEAWNLAPGKLTLVDDSGDLAYQVELAEERKRRRPYLKHGEQLLAGVSYSDFPLYCGRPPSLVIHSTQPQRWQISLRGEGNARPNDFRSFRMSDLPVRSHRADNFIWLDLSIDELLGTDPIGRFEITVRGPLGHSHTLGLRMIPQVSIEGHDIVHMSQPDVPASLRIVTDAETSVRPSSFQAGMELRKHWLSESQREYSVNAKSSIQEVSLQLSHHSGATVPLSIPIRRLRWSLATGLPRESEPKWQTRPFSIFPDGLAADAVLHVEFPLLAEDKRFYVGWRLIDTDGHIVRAVPPNRHVLQRLVTVPFVEVIGLWREKQETLLWQLVVHVAGQVQPVVVDLLYLLPDVGRVQYDWEEDVGQILLRVSWEHPHPGHKQLLLWPQDRPWAEVPITLSASHKEDLTRIEWRLPRNAISPESYLGELATVKPWESQRPQRPTLEQPNTFLIQPPGMSRHFAEMVKLRDQGRADAEQLLALFSHQHNSEQMHEFYKTNQALTNMRDGLALKWLIRWAETTHMLDSTAYKSTQLWMFSPSVIDRLAMEEHSDHELARYFRHLRVDKPFEKLHLWVLRSRLRAVPRRQCLKLLCSLHLKRSTLSEVMAGLLEDVGDGSLLFTEAITILESNSQAAAEWLAIQGNQDAGELLRELTLLYDLEVSWIWPKMTVDTNYGPVFIDDLRDRDTGRVRHCTLLSSGCYVEGALQLSPSVASVRLDLSNRLLRFSDLTPYQCQHCHRLFTDMSGFERHHESMHFGQVQACKRLTQDQDLAWIRPHNDEMAEERS